MTIQLAVRLDDQSERALERLTAEGGKQRSEVVREAIVALDRARMNDLLRSQSAAIMDDAADQANSRQIFEEMRAHRAW